MFQFPVNRHSSLEMNHQSFEMVKLMAEEVGRFLVLEYYQSEGGIELHRRRLRLTEKIKTQIIIKTRFIAFENNN